MKKFLWAVKIHGRILNPVDDTDLEFMQLYKDSFWWRLSPHHIPNTQPWNQRINTLDRTVLY